MPARSTVLYVSSEGCDTWSGRYAAPTTGRKDGPLATIYRARDVVRQLRAVGKIKGPVRVLLRGGTYTLDRTFELLPEDSGAAGAEVTYGAYPGEQPILSGGVEITGWQVTEHNGKACWKASLPELASGARSFTQLFVNGVRRPRTRRPAEGYFRFAELPEGRSGLFRRVKSAGFEAGHVQASWKNQDDVDVVTIQHWFDSHLHIDRVDEPARVVHFKNPALSDLSDENNLNARYYVENVFEDLALPGQWYLDRPTATLYYLPLPGERPESTRVIAPRLETLVHFRGSYGGPRVHHVRLENLAFQHAQWRLPEANAGAIQGAFNVPGAIRLQAVEDCVLYGLHVSHVAQYAVEIGTGSRRVRVLACDLRDLGGGGVKVDSESGLRPSGDAGAGTLTSTGAFQGLDIDLWGPPDRQPCLLPGRDDAPGADVEIADCTISDGGILYHSAHGVWVGDTGYVHVHHNEISYFRYSGISSGWTWSYCPSYTVCNRYEYNHIHHIGMGVLSDLGGIYTLGLHPGSTIVGNHIHDVSAYGYGGWGIYEDQASSYFRIENNLVYRTQAGGFIQNYAKDTVVRNNVFAMARDNEINPGRAEAVLTMVFENNIIYGAGGGPVSGSWVRPMVFADRNVYWRDDGKALAFNHFPLEHWQSRGFDVHSVAADPLFAAPRSGDFTLRADSPALKLGFVPLDPAQAGPRKGPRPATCAGLPAQKIVKAPVIGCKFELGLPTAPTAAPGDYEKLSNEIDYVPAKPGQKKQVSFTIQNFGRARGKGAIAISLQPARAGRADAPRKIAYDLAPGERKSVTFNVELAKGAKSVCIHATPQTPAKPSPRERALPHLTPAALLITLDQQPTWSIPRLPAIASPEQVAAAMRSQPALELPWAEHTAGTFRCAVAGDHLAVLAEINDVRLEQSRPPWDGSCIEIFGAQGSGKNGQIVLAPDSRNHPQQGWVFRGGCAPDDRVRLHTSKRDGGYTLSVLIPADLLKFDPAGGELLLEISLTTALAAAQGDFIRVQAFGATCPSANSTGYARVTIK